MKVISVNVGLPRQHEFNGEQVTTAIFKEPVEGKVALRSLNFDGDQQADLTVHGGPLQAAYLYPAEHYEFWKQELPEYNYNWGMFGENLTVTGLFENELNVGDVFQIGAARVRITQPRVPCSKLNLRFGRNDMVKRFAKKLFTGFYIEVLEEGAVGAGDSITLLSRDEHALKVLDLSRLFLQDQDNIEMMRRVVAHPLIPPVWKNHYTEQIAKRTAS